jgi:hypothetical protein
VGWLRRLYRILSWATIAGLVVTLFLILRPSSPPRVSATPEATRRADAKVREFQMSLQGSSEGTLEMDEAELNGWLGANLAIPTMPGKDDPAPEPDLEQVQSSVREVRIQLLDDSLRAYVLFQILGKSLSLELEGRLMVQDGCLRLEPTSGRLGSLPLLPGTLQSAAQRLFDSPENKEKFRLPPHIRTLTVDQGRLIVSAR